MTSADGAQPKPRDGAALQLSAWDEEAARAQLALRGIAPFELSERQTIVATATPLAREMRDWPLMKQRHPYSRSDGAQPDCSGVNRASAPRSAVDADYIS